MKGRKKEKGRSEERERQRERNNELLIHAVI
jgi:hypothetical protein